MRTWRVIKIPSGRYAKVQRFLTQTHKCPVKDSSEFNKILIYNILYEQKEFYDLSFYFASATFWAILCFVYSRVGMNRNNKLTNLPVSAMTFKNSVVTMSFLFYVFCTPESNCKVDPGCRQPAFGRIFPFRFGWKSFTGPLSIFNSVREAYPHNLVVRIIKAALKLWRTPEFRLLLNPFWILIFIDNRVKKKSTSFCKRAWQIVISKNQSSAFKVHWYCII